MLNAKRKKVFPYFPYEQKIIKYILCSVVMGRGDVCAA
jgi:hypothetical protein